MQLKILLNKILSIIALAVCILFAALLLSFIFKNGAESAPAPLVTNTTSVYEQEKVNVPIVTNTTSVYEQEKVNVPINLVGSPLPVRLKIPKIGIDTVVEHVGLTKGRALDVPKGPSNVAWFALGPLPGEVGSAVIDGHSGYKNNRPAVFDNLHKLKKGDKIYVENSEGVIITFVVRELRSYGNKEDSSDVFGSNDKASHLNLITCAGDWNPLTQTHSDRLVVFTDREI